MEGWKATSRSLDPRTALLTLLALGAVLLIIALPALLHNFTIPPLALDYGDIIAICSLLLTILIGVSSLLPNLRSIAETARSTHYSQLDTMYQQILVTALEKPYLRNPRECRDGDRKLQYQNYAYIVWNFLETVRDRSGDDPELRATWGPVIAAEHAIHRDWFFEETTPYRQKINPKFCLGFADFIWRKWPEVGASSGNTTLTGGEWILESWQYRTLPEIESDHRVRRFLEGE